MAQVVPMLPLYSISMAGSSLVLVLHLLPPYTVSFFLLSATYGVFYGMQNALVAIVPVTVFGRELLPQVFGYITLTIGIACLGGPPLIGNIL